MRTTSLLRRSQQGFSLAEVLAALTIMGILLAIVAPRMSGVSDLARGSRIINQLVADLSVTRMNAIRAGNTARLLTDATGTTYRIVVRRPDDPAVPGVRLDTVKVVELAREYPGWRLVPAGDSIVFDSRGLRRSLPPGKLYVQLKNANRDSLMISPIGKVDRVR